MTLSSEVSSQPTRDSLYTTSKDSVSITTERLELFDYSRNRSIPVALYYPDTLTIKQPMVVFNHGYNENQGTPYLSYAYLNTFLARHGYFVVSIQHELPSDDPLPTTGNLREKRMPNWENGVQNILFVVPELKTRLPNLDDKRVNVIGHSNGGDISMLFATEYPRKTRKAISLDNRRMPIPAIDTLKIYSLRANDLPADEGVIPSVQKQIKHGMSIITLPNTKHIEMCDDTATEEQKKEIQEYVLKFLEEKVLAK
jgi:predicted peptidase